MATLTSKVTSDAEGPSVRHEKCCHLLHICFFDRTGEGLLRVAVIQQETGTTAIVALAAHISHISISAAPRLHKFYSLLQAIIFPIRSLRKHATYPPSLTAAL